MHTRLGLVSAYSFLFGVHKQGELLDRAASYGVRRVSVCDLNNLYGVHTFLEAAKERNIEPIIGAALTTKREKGTCSSESGIGNRENGIGGHEKRTGNSDKGACSSEKGTINLGKETGNSEKIIYCFVENRAGFGRLCEILSERNKDKEHFDPLPHLRENARGLVLASPDTAALEYLHGQVKHLYAAITPVDISAVLLSRKLNLPLAFLDNSLFLEPEDHNVHRVLRAISLLKTIGNLDPGDIAAKERILQPSKEIERYLVSWPEAFKGTEEIAAICTFNDLFDKWIFPNYEAGGLKNKELSVADELRRRVYQGNVGRYGELGDRELGRIEYELNIIEEKGFSSYFLIIDDIIKMVSRTCGRGSGAASIVSYGLGITNVDPLRHNLYFERFLNPARTDPPDLDIDFAWDERDDLIKVVIEKYSAAHCARVANHNFFRYRSALRETAKAYGFGDHEITGVERKLALMDEASGVMNDPLWQEIFFVAKKIKGLPRGLGMHCGGLVITPEPINFYVPIEKSAEGYPLLAWEKEGVEAAGFVKIDLLGNRSLAVIRDAARNIKEQIINGTKNGELERELSRAVDNKETIEALSCGDSIGVFYIESPAMRQLQKKTNRGDFEHIVIHSSIIRPAANKFITEYVRRLKGGAWEPLHPRLEKILDESYGILCYQEDVSKTAVALAGFNEIDADKLRKVIAKKMGGTKLAAYQNQFFDGCRKNNVSEETIQKIWEMMLSFDGYSFCKPHSASYAMVSFQSAYLRVHHPAEFMAAVLSNQGGYYRPHAYIAESRRMRLLAVGPDINVSGWRYYGKTNHTKNHKEEKFRGTLVIGLMAIKGLSASGAKQIIEEREQGGEYKSLLDFSQRIRLNRDDIIALSPAGVFDSIADGLPRSLQARQLLGSNKKQTLNSKEKNGELFEVEALTSFGNNSFSAIALHNNQVKKTSTDLWEEYRVLGFLRNSHPLLLWKDAVLGVKHRVKALHIGEYLGQNILMVGWPVTQKEVWTKDGLAMSFLSLEDETALYETVIFPKTYDKYNKLLFDQQPLLVYGRVMNDQGAISLEVQRIELLVAQEH